MKRFLAVAGLAAVVALGSWAVAAIPPPDKAAANPAPSKKTTARPSQAGTRTAKTQPHLNTRDVYRALAQRSTVSFPPNTTIQDALNLLIAKTHVPMLIEEETFANGRRHSGST